MDAHSSTTPEVFFNDFSSWRTDQQVKEVTELADLKPTKIKPPASMIAMSENEIDK
jgi:hypothetical protein